MKRATLLLDDVIYERVKHLGRQRGTTLKEVLNDLLRMALNAMPQKRFPKIKVPLHRKGTPIAGVDLADRNSLYDMLEDHPLIK